MPLKDLHHQIRVERVRETGMWLLSADVTGERDKHRIGDKPTSVINPHAEIVAQVPLMTVGMAIADISYADDHHDRDRIDPKPITITTACTHNVPEV